MTPSVRKFWPQPVAAALAALLLFLGVPLPHPMGSTAQAAVGSQAKIYVFPIQAVFKGAPPDVTSQVTELLKNEIKHSEEVSLQKGPVFIPETVTTAVKPMSDTELKAAEKLRKDGEKLYNELKFAEAAKALQAAVNKYEGSLALLGDFGPIVEALLNLAVCYYRTDNDEEGAKVLIKVIRLAPDLTLDPEKYPPMFRNTVEALRKKLLLKARGELEVGANEDGATVFLNGHKVGTVPILLKELVPGEHYIRVEKEGLQPWAEKVTVVSTQRKQVLAALGGAKKASGPLGEIAEALQKNRLPTSVVDIVAQQGKEIGADFVALGGIARVGNNYRVGIYLVKVGSREVCPMPEVQLDPDLLGASVEIYNMASTMFKRVEGCPDPIAGGVAAVVSTAKAKPAELRAVAVGPAPVAEPPAPAEERRTPAVASGGPAQPAAAGPAVPATAGGPAVPRGPASPRSPAQPAGPGLPPRPTPPAPAVVTTSDGLATTGGSALSSPSQPVEVAPQIVPRYDRVDVIKPVDEDENRGTPWYGSWWFWTLVGAAVVGGTVGGLYAGGVFSGGTNGASVSVHWPPM